MHVFRGKWADYWQCSIVKEHNCHIEEIEFAHRNLSSAFIANVMYGEIVDNLRYEPRSIIRAIEQRFQYTINYAKAWRAKQKAIEMRFGTYEDSYHNLPRQLATICARNPGSYYDIKHYPSTDVEYSGKRVLQHAFFAFGATIKAFRYCRPIICLDGTFLTGKYKG